MQIFKNLENHIEHIALILIVTVLSMVAYFLTSPQPSRERTKSAFDGGVIDGVLSYPTWALIRSFTFQNFAPAHFHLGMLFECRTNTMMPLLRCVTWWSRSISFTVVFNTQIIKPTTILKLRGKYGCNSIKTKH